MGGCPAGMVDPDDLAKVMKCFRKPLPTSYTECKFVKDNQFLEYMIGELNQVA
jgi:hypothetical protein